MSDTKSKIGFGVVLQRSDGSGGWTDVGDEIYSVKVPSVSADTFERTHMKSLNAYREFGKTLRDGGEVSVSIAYIPGDSDVTAAIADINSDENADYRINFFDTHACAFNAVATGFEPDVPMEEKMTCTLTYKVSGEPTYGAIT
jgi:hypothetical protein